ncbi:hypothetical protein PAXRUDRAFT_691942, partial [Paxillus rubicundulus Ve08.2h10]
RNGRCTGEEIQRVFISYQRRRKPLKSQSSFASISEVIKHCTPSSALDHRGPPSKRNSLSERRGFDRRSSPWQILCPQPTLDRRIAEHFRN